MPHASPLSSPTILNSKRTAAQVVRSCIPSPLPSPAGVGARGRYSPSSVSSSSSSSSSSGSAGGRPAAPRRTMAACCGRLPGGDQWCCCPVPVPLRSAGPGAPPYRRGRCHDAGRPGAGCGASLITAAGRRCRRDRCYPTAARRRDRHLDPRATGGGDSPAGRTPRAPNSGRRPLPAGQRSLLVT